MKTFAGLAVQGMLLVLASPAAAQGRSVEGGEHRTYRPMAPRPHSVPVPTAATEPRISLAEMLPLPPSADLNVGFLSIPAATGREMARRRTDFSREGRRGRTGAAALGLSLRF